MNKLKYTYCPRGNQWAVLTWDFHKNGRSGTVIAYYNNMEDAKDLAKHLNDTEPEVDSDPKTSVMEYFTTVLKMDQKVRLKVTLFH